MDKDIKWKSKLQDLLSTCQEEIVRTTTIGKKMLHASKINSGLNSTYQALGVMLVEAIQRNEINWDEPKVKKMIEDVERFKFELSNYENEVNQIKKDSLKETKENSVLNKKSKQTKKK